MRALLCYIFIFHTFSAIASLDNVNEFLFKDLESQNRRLALKCYVKDDFSSINISQKTLNQKTRQEISFNNSVFHISIEPIDDSYIKVSIENNNNLLYHYKIHKEEHSFKADMLNLKQLSNHKKLYFLSSIECFYGEEFYFSNLKNYSTISLHYESYYWSYSKYLQDLYTGYFNYDYKDGSNKLILIDGYEEKPKSQNQLTNIIETQTRTLHTSLPSKLEFSGKIAPNGLQHINLNTNAFILMGSFFNMCSVNIMKSVVKSLLSSNKDIIRIDIPAHYNFTQTMGVTKTLNVPKQYTGSLLNLLKNQQLYSNFKKGLKDYLESEFSYNIEVLFNEDVQETNNKVIRIKIYTY